MRRTRGGRVVWTGGWIEEGGEDWVGVGVGCWKGMAFFFFLFLFFSSLLLFALYGTLVWAACWDRRDCRDCLEGG